MMISPEKKEILEKIGLIALDLDKTLLTSAGLTENSKECLEEAIRRGYQVVVATGRPFSALPAGVFDINGLDYVICSNGAHIIDLSTGYYLYSDYLSEEASIWCRDRLKALGYHIEVFSGGKAYTDKERYEKCRNGVGVIEGAAYVLRTRIPVDNIWEVWNSHLSEIENINIIFEDQEDKKRVWEELKSCENIGFTVTSSTSYNLEIGGENTSKANALSQLSSISGIPLERVMSFGDSPNDMAMIMESGFGVAVDNALPEVKEVSDYVTASNEDEGVAKAIRLLLFKEDTI